MSASRRGLLVGAGALASGAVATGAAARAAPIGAAHGAAWLQEVLERFAGFGVKASGGPGDRASGAWLEGELTGLGFQCERQSFEVPHADVRTATLAVGDRRAAVIPQAIVATTGAGGLSAPIKLSSAGGAWTARSR